MEKYRRYYGVFTLIGIILISAFVAYKMIVPAWQNLKDQKSQIEQKESELNNKSEQKQNVEDQLARIRNSMSTSEKKIYSPIDSDLGNDTLFFTLYKDVIEMVHSNSIKIKSMEYSYNPESDSFVKFGKDIYFVCELKMELISNYTNLGKFIQDIVQYPYYVKINNIQVEPYEKDKKILVSKVSLMLYAHTAPDETSAE